MLSNHDWSFLYYQRRRERGNERKLRYEKGYQFQGRSWRNHIHIQKAKLITIMVSIFNRVKSKFDFECCRNMMQYMDQSMSFTPVLLFFLIIGQHTCLASLLLSGDRPNISSPHQARFSVLVDKYFQGHYTLGTVPQGRDNTCLLKCD